MRAPLAPAGSQDYAAELSYTPVTTRDFWKRSRMIGKPVPAAECRGIQRGCVA